MRGGAGRPPKPTALKILQGNPGKRRLPANEPKPKGKPSCPAWLCDRAREIWLTHAPGLISDGLLTKRDEEAFAAFCHYTALWEGLAVAQYGLKLTSVKLAMLCNRADKARQRADRLGAQFGMTPSARVGLALPPKSPQPKDEEFFFGRRDQA